MERVVTYKGIDNHLELAIRVTLGECFIWGGIAICDLCNEDSEEHGKYMYLCPELGSNALCEKCFKEYQGRAKYYKEDKEFMLTMLDSYMKNYKLSFKDGDIEIIDMYKRSLD